MNYLKGLVKGTTVFIILCLAVYGAFVLLKRPAELKVSEEDRVSLQKDHGIEILSNDTTGGRSAFFNTVSGAPPVGAKPSGNAKTVVPTAMSGMKQASSAPPFDEAPPFAASTAASEAPPFAASTAASEAPPFAASTAASEAPPFVMTSPLPAPPSAAFAQPAPLYGNQHPFASPASVPAPSVSQGEAAKPASVPASVPAPNASQGETAKPASVPASVPAPSVSQSEAAKPVPVPASVSTPNVSQGEAAKPVSLPASVPASNVSQGEAAKPVSFPASVPAPSVSQDEAAKPVSLPPIPSTFVNSPWDGPADAVAAPISEDPWGTPAKSAVAVTTQTVEKKEVVAFVPPRIKPLPKVEEELPTQVVAASPIPLRSEPIPQPVPAMKSIPEEYRQASIRRISTAPSPDEAPVVSFSPITPTPKIASPTAPKNEPSTPVETSQSPLTERMVLTEKTASAPLAPVALPHPAPNPVPNPAPTPSFVEPKLASTVAAAEAVPFLVEDPISAEPVVETTPLISLPTPPAQLKSEIREPVARFVKAQCELIQTNDPNKIRTAYIQLSRLYDHPELNVFERAYLTPILDHLAVDVIFSKQNSILEAPYIVRVGETAYTLRSGEVLTVSSGNSIDSIAATFNLTPSLLMKINGLTNKRPLEPGTELKVVLGQFDARVSAERRECTLILGGLYAGRFPVDLGEEIQNVRGDFTVTFKGDTPQGRSLTLSNGITLRGVDRPQPGDSLRSAIRFSERDAVELFDILSERSVVVIAK